VVQPSWLARLALPAAAGPEIYLGYRAGKLRQKEPKGGQGATCLFQLINVLLSNAIDV